MLIIMKKNGFVTSRRLSNNLVRRIRGLIAGKIMFFTPTRRGTLFEGITRGKYLFRAS